MAKNETENFIDLSFGEIRLRLPNNQESILIVKRHIDALHKSFTDMPSIVADKEEERVEISVEDPTETIEPMDKPFVRNAPIQKLPVIREEAEVRADPITESYTVCPLCQGKLKKKKITQVGNEIRQTVLCKKRGCNFKRDYIFSI